MYKHIFIYVYIYIYRTVVLPSPPLPRLLPVVVFIIILLSLFILLLLHCHRHTERVLAYFGEEGRPYSLCGDFIYVFDRRRLKTRIAVVYIIISLL